MRRSRPIEQYPSHSTEECEPTERQGEREQCECCNSHADAATTNENTATNRPMLQKTMRNSREASSRLISPSL